MKYQLNPQHAALVVVDMQKGFIEEGAAMEVAPGREIIPNINRLRVQFANREMSVFFTRFVYSTKVPNLIGELHQQHKPPVACCMLGHPSVEIVNDLMPLENDLVIDKHGYDAFHNTNFDYALRSRKIKQLIFTGVMTDICVLSTITSALHHEYQLWVTSDATATLWPEVQSITLDLIDRAYGMVATTDQILSALKS